MQVTLSSKGQLVLPAPIRRRLRLKARSKVELEERDGGVYIELEAIALSRDIPVSFRWIVEPIVRRISRSSLTTSLRQTEGAVRSGVTLAACNTPNKPCSTVMSDALGSNRNSAAVLSLR